jgi:hypothetical protein
VLRHTALFQWQTDVGEQEQLLALKGLAYLAYACSSVLAVDFGVDLFGGSERLRNVKPWERTPLWKARTEGPPAGFDMALHLDFEGLAGLEDYNKDDAHHEVAVYNASICRGEFTARVDWEYDGPFRTRRFGIRHTSLFLWDEAADDSAKSEARSALESVSEVPGVSTVAVADNVGTLTTDYDLILDVMIDDYETAKEFGEHPAVKAAFAQAATATKHEWTARATHRMGSG